MDPGSGSTNGRRNIIVAVGNGLFNNQKVLAGLQAAVDEINAKTDPYGNTNGYWLKLEPTSNTGDIWIVTGNTQAVCQSPLGCVSPRQPGADAHVTFSDEVNESYFTVEDVRGLAVHEMSHPLGLANAGGCASAMNGFTTKTVNTPTGARIEHHMSNIHIQPDDINKMNQFLINAAGLCTAEEGLAHKITQMDETVEYEGGVEEDVSEEFSYGEYCYDKWHITIYVEWNIAGEYWYVANVSYDYIMGTSCYPYPI